MKKKYDITVRIEKRSGLDCMSSLDDEVENLLEGGISKGWVEANLK